jgi:hypothetical protein
MTELHTFSESECQIGESENLSPPQCQVGMAMIENPEGSRKTRRSAASEPRTYTVGGCLRRLTTLISIFEIDYLEFPDGTPEVLAREFQCSVQEAVGQLKRVREVLLKSSRLCAQRKMMSRHKMKREFNRNLKSLVKSGMKDRICESTTCEPLLDMLQSSTIGTTDVTIPCKNKGSDTSIDMDKNTENPITLAAMNIGESTEDISTEEILNARFSLDTDSEENALMTSNKPEYEGNGLAYKVDYTLRDICVTESVDDHGNVTPSDPDIELVHLSGQVVQDILNSIEQKASAQVSLESANTADTPETPNVVEKVYQQSSNDC